MRPGEWRFEEMGFDGTNRDRQSIDDDYCCASDIGVITAREISVFMKNFAEIVADSRGLSRASSTGVGWWS